jgi:GntR family transcriptional regulator
MDMRFPGEKVIPLYSRVESVIRGKIVSGEFEPGRRLPTENEFVSQFSVSKITVRNALSRLEAEGFITRNRGKGTYVQPEIPLARQFIFTGMHDIVRALEDRKIEPLETQKMKVGETKIARDLSLFFGLSNQDEIHCVRRLCLRERIPVSYFENYMPGRLARRITKQEILRNGSITKILKEKMRLSGLRGEMHLEALPADPDIARILQFQTFSPVLHTQIFFRLSSGEPLQVHNGYLKAEYYKYTAPIGMKDFDKI